MFWAGGVGLGDDDGMGGGAGRRPEADRRCREVTRAARRRPDARRRGRDAITGVNRAWDPITGVNGPEGASWRDRVSRVAFGDGGDVGEDRFGHSEALPWVRPAG